MRGFDEYIGSPCHLNASEEPENRDYPAKMKLADGKTFLETYGPRGVLKCKVDGKGGQTIQDTGPLTKKRRETIDEETLAAAKDSIQRQQKAGGPFFGPKPGGILGRRLRHLNGRNTGQGLRPG